MSTDKACNPVNLYGATKLCAEKLFVNGNQLSGTNNTKFSVVRYGNVISSRGSVIPFFQKLLKSGEKELPLTHNEMTRFFITLLDAVKFVINCLKTLEGGEVFIPKMPSIYIRDLIKIIDPKAKIKITSIRPGEKIHESLCSPDESIALYQQNNYYTIYAANLYFKKKNGKKIKSGFSYNSGHKDFLNKNQIEKIIKKENIL